jgi:hypothetical protein
MQAQHSGLWKPVPSEQFAALGLRDVAYVKEKRQENGRVAYAIHTADGNEVAIVAGRDLAFATVRHNDLEPLSVH